ncbi:MAG: VRR-NUC domain-containing protein [Nocardioidaceae bacterium]
MTSAPNGRNRAMSEDDLLSCVVDLARLLGLRTAHFRPAKTDRGWRTPVQGDGKGFPDLVIVGPGGVLYRELKGTRGRQKREQVAWEHALHLAGADVAVWTPRQWPELIEWELRVVAGRAEVAS